ncbi:DUF4082 domain-containing protein [Cryobacterium sp. 1639]|uniref:DUF4082 domain-containing protein n=1 Tax=Cryobacterium inferilacus TaxID=2866629 RepID=UPI001C738A81|nr:DUF4082 domain-containing protein [Cryobacterium sp. 1639]MBX0299451.1 DUF4082 domain-containing protein [Cryobacterium sp. 1639]
MYPLGGPASQIASTPRSLSPRGRIAVVLSMLLALLLAASQWAVSPAGAATSTIFGTSTPSSLVQHTDSQAVEVGTRFTARSNGTATAMRFWKTQDAGGTHTGTLWSAQGAKLAGATFSTASGSGWQSAKFDRAVALKAGQTYTVSYQAPKGRYAATQNYTGKSLSPDLAIAAGAGVFRYGATSQVPTGTYRNSMYWVDVEFAPTAVAPAPQPTTAPSPVPAPGAFPDASTTGPPAGTTLKPSGGVTITTNGAVYDGYKFSGDIMIRANNVTIRNSVVDGRIAIRPPYTGLQVQRTEIVGPGPGYATKYPAIGFANFSCDACDIHGWGDGAMMDNNVTVKNSWIHDIAVSGGSHNQAILSLGGSNYNILNNRLDAGPDANFTASLSFLNQWGAFTNTLVQGNLFNGGGYCVYAGGEAKGNAARPSSNVRFLDNTFGKSLHQKCGFYGPVTAFDPSGAGNQWQGNRWEDGKSVPAG